MMDYSTVRLVQATLFAGSTIISLIEVITGVSDYKTMVEMAKKGDRYKCDLGLKDMHLQQEISSLV